MNRTTLRTAWARLSALFPVALLPALCLALPSHATSAPSLRVQWVGTYSVESARRMPEQTSPTGIRLVGRGAKPTKQTQSVAPELGSNFGVGFVLLDPPNTEPTTLRQVWRYPQGGLTNPANGKTYTSTESESKCGNNKVCFIGYRFMEPWEQVAGTWTAEVWYGSTLLLSQEFFVGMSERDTK